MNTANKPNVLLIAAGAIFAIWGILGWVDVGNYAQGGFNTDNNNTIVEVLAGSPSEAAGLQVGDYLLAIDGVSTEDAKTLSKRSRPEIGETRVFQVKRADQTIDIPIVFGEQVPQRKLLAHAGFLVGFCFLLITLLTYLRKPSRITGALAFTGVFFSFAFLNGPYFESATVRAAVGAISTLIVFLGVGGLLHFILTYRGSAYLEKANGKLLLFAPAIAIALFLGYRTIAQPPATGGLNTFTTVFVAVVALFYLLGSLINIWRIYSGANPQDRAAKALNLVLWGTVLAIVPVSANFVLSIFAPQVVLPGSNFYFLTLVLIPITWSMAAARAD